MKIKLLSNGDIWLYPKTKKQIKKAKKWYKLFEEKFDKFDDIPCWIVPIEEQLDFKIWTEINNIGLDENGQWFINGKGNVDIDTLIDMYLNKKTL